MASVREENLRRGAPGRGGGLPLKGGGLRRSVGPQRILDALKGHVKARRSLNPRIPISSLTSVIYGNRLPPNEIQGQSQRHHSLYMALGPL